MISGFTSSVTSRHSIVYIAIRNTECIEMFLYNIDATSLREDLKNEYLGWILWKAADGEWTVWCSCLFLFPFVANEFFLFEKKKKNDSVST